MLVVALVLACWGARERTRSQRRQSKAHVRPPRAVAAARVAIEDAIAAAAAAAAALSLPAHLLLLFSLLAPASQGALSSRDAPLAALPAAPAPIRYCTYLLCLGLTAMVPLKQWKRPEMGEVAVVERATLETGEVPVEAAAIAMAMAIHPSIRSVERHCRSSGRGRSPGADMRCNSNTDRCTFCRPAALLRCSLPMLDKGEGNKGCS